MSNHVSARVPAGGHWAATCAFAKAMPPRGASFKLVATVNPWRSGPSTYFFEKVLAKQPTTIGQMLDMAKALGIKGVPHQLGWFCTWGARFQPGQAAIIDGVPYPLAPQVEAVAAVDAALVPAPSPVPALPAPAKSGKRKAA